MLSKSLIQFSIDGWSCVPSLLFTWGQTMVEVMKIVVTSLKISHACTATLSAPTCSRPPGTHAPTRDSWIPTGKSRTVSVGALLLSPGSWCTRFCCAHQKSISQSCVSSGNSMVGLMITSTKGLMPYPSLLHPEPLFLQQTTTDLYLHRRCSNTVWSQYLWGPWVMVHTRFV